LVGLLAAQRLGDKAAADQLIQRLDGALPDGAWTSQVVEFLRSRIDGAQLLARAKDLGQKTEAHAYIGFKAETDGKRDDALTHLQWVVDQGAKTFVEVQMARREIERIMGGSR
jgi:lipoprotein NlpI